MKLTMSGLEHQSAPVGLRERLSFAAAEVELLDGALCALEQVSGAVLLSTCNRTELYLTGESQTLDAGKLLCQVTGEDWNEFEPFFVRRDGEDAARHLLEVASGLKSRIWGENQIVTQVGMAMERARAANSIDSVLSTLFHTAVAAAKDVRTSVRFRAVPASAASQAVERLREKLVLEQSRAVVIGNGEMGRLAARLLREAGCRVTVTLRTYRHGETVVPFGCDTIAYDRRLEAIDGADILFSATTSPHYTFSAQQAVSLARCPRYMIDLAIPRDIDPQAAEQVGAELYNVDDFGAIPQKTDAHALAQAERMIDHYLREFYEWQEYRACIPVMGELKQALSRRFLAEGTYDAQSQHIIDRTVELMLGGLKGCVTAETLRECAEKIDAFTRPKRRSGGQETPFRFPLFTDLRGKRVLIVGGGTIAQRRIHTLRPFGAELVVIAPELKGSAEGLEWKKRCYQAGDVNGAFLVIAATDSREINRQVGEAARAQSIPVSVADCREECTFFFPAICQGERVLAGVVSRGENHRETAAAAARIRAVLELSEQGKEQKQ